MSQGPNRTEKRKGCLQFGIAGIGVGASSVLGQIARSPYSVLRAGADIDSKIRGRFLGAFPSAKVYESVEQLCRDPKLDAIWVATPNRFHAEHAIAAAENGKHIIISKPMATSLREAASIIDSCARSGVKVIVGHSLGFSPALREMARLAQPKGALGPVRAIQLMAFTDWMLLPRIPEEVDAARGGGLVRRQSSHQIDALRLLGGGIIRSVRAHVGQWMMERKCPGFFAAFVEFENGAVGTVSHNGYGYMVAPEIIAWGSDVGISGKDFVARLEARRALRTPGFDEQALKDDMRLGGNNPLFRTNGERKPWLPLHLGLTTVSCDRGDMRHSPYGVFVYSDEGRSEIAVDDDGSWLGMSELEELYEAVVNGEPLYRDGQWGMATLEVTDAILESARLQREITLKHQVPVSATALKQTS